MSSKRSHKYRYNRGIIGLPSVLVALSWPAIWLVWTSLAGPRAVGWVPSGTRTVFSQPGAESAAEMDPRDIIRLQRGADQIDAPSSAAIDHYVPEPKYLERLAGRSRPKADVPYASSLRSPAEMDAGYRPDWLKAPVFPKRPRDKPQPLLEYSKQLKQYGFHLPKLVIGSHYIKANVL